MFNFDTCKCGNSDLTVLQKTDVQVYYRCLSCNNIFASPIAPQSSLYHDDDEAQMDSQTYME